MKLAQSRLTSQGQISVPAVIRGRLGLAPGSIMEWAAEGGHITVRRAGAYSFRQLHDVLFAETPTSRTLEELKAGIRRNIRGRHARR